MIIFVCLLTLGLLGIGKATGSIIDTVISGFFICLLLRSSLSTYYRSLL